MTIKLGNFKAFKKNINFIKKTKKEKSLCQIKLN